jgi:hypothetical protein
LIARAASSSNGAGKINDTDAAELTSEMIAADLALARREKACLGRV